jgi:DNA-binding MarR family transcriptional regulator
VPTAACGKLPGIVPQPLRFDPVEEAGRQWRANWGSPTVTPMTAATSIFRLHQILTTRLNEAIASFDLTYARYEALMLLFLSRTGSLPLGKMGQRLQVHPTSMTSLIDGLERDGYASRAPHPTDRRTTLATITERGREVAAQATERLNAIDFGMVPLSGDETAALTETLRKVRVDAGDWLDEDADA